MLREILLSVVKGLKEIKSIVFLSTDDIPSLYLFVPDIPHPSMSTPTMCYVFSLIYSIFLLLTHLFAVPLHSMASINIDLLYIRCLFRVV